MIFTRTAARNRDIFAAFEAGLTLEQLAVEYKLSPKSIAAILTAERHKRAVSPEPPYCNLRTPRVEAAK